MRRSTGRKKKKKTARFDVVCVYAHVFPGIRAEQSASFKSREGNRSVCMSERERGREGAARERQSREST